MSPHRPTRRLVFALPLLPAALAVADGPSTPSIMALMHKQYTVSRAPFKILKRELDATAPDWEKAREASEKFGGLAADLAKNTPLSGTPDSWRRMVGQHLADARALDDAVRARDKAKLRAAHQRIADSCRTCHQAHRSRGGG
jgi:cytochrome c556